MSPALLLKRRGTYLVLAIHSITTTTKATASPGAHWAVITPTSAALSIRAIAGHVTSVTADTADDVGSVVLLLRAVILPMTNLSAVLARLIFVIAKGSVQGSKLTQLVALELVLPLRDGCGLVISVSIGQVERLVGKGHSQSQ